MRHNFGDPPNTRKRMITFVHLLSGTRILGARVGMLYLKIGQHMNSVSGPARIDQHEDLPVAVLNLGTAAGEPRVGWI